MFSQVQLCLYILSHSLLLFWLSSLGMGLNHNFVVQMSSVLWLSHKPIVHELIWFVSVYEKWWGEESGVLNDSEPLPLAANKKWGWNGWEQPCSQLVDEGVWKGPQIFFKNQNYLKLNYPFLSLPAFPVHPSQAYLISSSPLPYLVPCSLPSSASPLGGPGHLTWLQPLWQQCLPCWDSYSFSCSWHENRDRWAMRRQGDIY